MSTAVKKFPLLKTAILLTLAFVITSSVAYGLLLRYLPPDPLRLNIRWADSVDASQRAELEQRLHLTMGELKEGTTWQYTLPSPTAESIRAIVQHPAVDDTAHIDRVNFRPDREQPAGSDRRVPYYAAAAGVLAAGACLLAMSRGR